MSDGTVVDIYEPVIADLRSRIATLQAMLDNLESLRGGATLQTTGNTSATRPTTAAFSNDAFFGMTAGEAAKKYLNALKKTATVNAIMETLLAGGWKTSAKNITENLRTILSRHPDFVRINGEFGLAEWYPGRKTTRRQGPAISNVSDDESSSFEVVVAKLAGNQERTSTVPTSPSEK